MRNSLPMTLLALCAAWQPVDAALTAEALYSQVSPSVWVVQALDAEGLPLQQGSAVVTAPQRLVTNCHVLARAHQVKIRRDKQSHAARLVAWDPQRDLCELQAPTLDAPPVARADATALKVGQPVYAIGSPLGMESTLSAGLVAGLRRNQAQQLVVIQFSASVSKGSSGGGLFDDQGRLVGMPTSGVPATDGQNLNFAIPANWIDDLPQRHARLRAQPPAAVSSAPSVNDLTRMPSFATREARSNYRLFLERSHPRAFALAESGDGHYAAGDSSTGNPVEGTVSERALRVCERLSRSTCHLYAVDDEVVYREPSPPAKKP